MLLFHVFCLEPSLGDKSSCQEPNETFFAAYPPVFSAAPQATSANRNHHDAEEAQCEDALMEAFQK
jgi:hypothetical protein